MQQKLRAGALEIKKVCGEANPADFFTKHLSSEDRVSDLCRLFRCRFTVGRAAGAPSLKRHGLEEKLLAVDMIYASVGPTLEQEGFVYPAGDYEGEAVPEAYLHDSSQLPHLIGGDLRLLFPRAVPAAELDELMEGPDWLEQRATASRCEPTVEMLQDKIAAANALIAKTTLSTEDIDKAKELIAEARTVPLLISNCQFDEPCMPVRPLAMRATLRRPEARTVLLLKSNCRFDVKIRSEDCLIL